MSYGQEQCNNNVNFLNNLLGRNNNWLPPLQHADGLKTKIFVGVSGGVDSSVSAALLKKKGYDVTGVFMRTYYPPQLKCDWREERLDAMRVCEYLQIPFLDCDLEAEYKNKVFDYMIDSYKSGITPNPDVFCNKYVKFGGFLEWAQQEGCDYIATGHYAQHFRKKSDFEEDEARGRRDIPKEVGLQGETFERSMSKRGRSSEVVVPGVATSGVGIQCRHGLGMGADHDKDQTYFLYQLQQHQLEKALFPIGHLEKNQVRKLAKKFGLFTAEKKDSQGLCFVGPVDMQEFLRDYIEQKPGDVLDERGVVMGSHGGAAFLTIGQRTGFEIDPQHKTPDMKKLFIIAKDIDANTITVSPSKSEYDPQQIILKDVSFVADKMHVGDTVDSRIRHRGKLLPTRLEKIENNQYSFSFEQAHSGVASGQSLVLYRDNICIGGGIVV